MAANRSVVKAAKFREVLQDASSFATSVEATNDQFYEALDLMVREAGGDMARLSEEQQKAFGDQLAAWLAKMIEEL